MKIAKRFPKYELVADAVRSRGTYNPDEITFMFMEQLTVKELEQLTSFLDWVHRNGFTFGRGNKDIMWNKWKDECGGYIETEQTDLPDMKDVTITEIKPQLV